MDMKLLVLHAKEGRLYTGWSMSEATCLDSIVFGVRSRVGWGQRVRVRLPCLTSILKLARVLNSRLDTVEVLDDLQSKAHRVVLLLLATVNAFGFGDQLTQPM